MRFWTSWRKEKRKRENRIKAPRVIKLTHPPSVYFILNRKWYTDRSTIGELSVSGEFQCYTLEDTVRDPNKDGILQKKEKIAGVTAIPSGEYEVSINFSGKFQRRLPLLLNVPHFKGIRIHLGNTDADTRGCVLLGQSRGPDYITDSAPAFDAFFAKLEDLMEKSKVFLIVKGRRR